MLIGKFAANAALLVMIGLATSSCKAEPNPTVRVGMGMTVGELVAGSTYPLAATLQNPKKTGACTAKDSWDNEHWMFNDPYDLIFVHEGHELVKRDLGGLGYLIAITTHPDNCRVDSLTVSFQNRLMTLDEVLAEAQKLKAWLVGVGFRDPSDAERRNEILSDGISFEQEDGAPKLTRKLTGIADIRAAFLDEKAMVNKVGFAGLVAGDTGASIWIENSTQSRLHRPVDDLETKQAFRIYFDVGVRNKKAREQMEDALESSTFRPGAGFPLTEMP